MTDNENIVSAVYDSFKETQVEIYKRETRRTRNSIFWIGGIFLFGVMIGLAAANKRDIGSFFNSIILPLLFAGIGFLALKQPLLSVIIAALLFIGVIILEFMTMGARAAISGWLVKGAVIYLLFAALQSAREAERAKKEMV